MVEVNINHYDTQTHMQYKSENSVHSCPIVSISKANKNSQTS